MSNFDGYQGLLLVGIMFIYILHGTSSIVLPTVRDTSFTFWQSYPWNKGSLEEFNKHFLGVDLSILFLCWDSFVFFFPINSLFTTFAYIWLGQCFFITYKFKCVNYKLVISSVQFSCSVVSDSLRPHELQHARPPCPSPSPGVHSNSRPSSWCCKNNT